MFPVRLEGIDDGPDGRRVWTALKRDGTIPGAAIGPDGLIHAGCNGMLPLCATLWFIRMVHPRFW
jgi:hypothetical protein